MATFAHRTDTGPAVRAAGPIHRRILDRRQALARRNALWLRASTDGMTCGVTGRTRVHPVSELAQVWGVSRHTVLNGLAAARLIVVAIDGGEHD